MPLIDEAGETTLAPDATPVPDALVVEGTEDKTSEAPDKAAENGKDFGSNGAGDPAKAGDQKSAQPLGTNSTGEPQPGDDNFKPKGGWQKRIHELTKEAKSWQEKAEALEQDRAKTPSVDPSDPPPKPEDYADKTWDDYYDARSAWRARQEIRAEREKAKQAELTQAQEAAKKADKAVEAEHLSRFQARAAELQTKIANFKEIAFAEDVPNPQHVFDELLHMEKGADVLYYLGNHKAEAAELAELSGRELQRKLWQIEDKLSAAPPVITTKAPAPITPVSGSGGSVKYDPNKHSDDMADYRAWRGSPKR